MNLNMMCFLQSAASNQFSLGNMSQNNKTSKCFIAIRICQFVSECIENMLSHFKNINIFSGKLLK